MRRCPVRRNTQPQRRATAAAGTDCLGFTPALGGKASGFTPENEGQEAAEMETLQRPTRAPGARRHLCEATMGFWPLGWVCFVSWEQVSFGTRGQPGRSLQVSAQVLF